MATIPASENEYPQLLFTEVAAPSTPASGLVVCYAKSDGLIYCKDDAGTETAYGALPAHLADTSDAHDASAISVLDAGANFTGTDVESVLAELFAAIGAGGIPATIIDAAGDLIVGSAADTVVRLAKGAAGGNLGMSNGAVAWDAGTSFPGSPATGDRFYRTDRALEYYYDGTRWLTTTLYVCDMPSYVASGVTQPFGSTVNPARSVAPTDLYNIWVVDFRTLMRVATTNNGTNFWTMTLASVGGAGATLASVNTSADAADTILRKTASVGALFGTTNTLAQTQVAKTLSPGTLDVVTSQFTYRFVG